MFVAHGLMLAGVGVAIGLIGGIRGHAADVLVAVRGQPGRSADLRLVSLTLIAATVLASYVPALRATAVDPIEALRSE